LRKLVASESELNSCGYVLLMSGRVKESITVFRINVNLFPQSVNCLDSLGEAYVIAGQNDKAIQAYEAALHLDPSNENVKKELNKLKGS
jgi:cytochrome c-type biogenesis protein CcmH/NrfG